MNMLEYCKQDVEVTHALYNHLKPEEWSPRSRQLEHDLAEICHRIGNHGWEFNREKASALYAKLSADRLNLEAELKTLFEPWEDRTEFVPKVNNSKLGYVKGEPVTKVRVIEFNPNSRAHIQHCLEKSTGGNRKSGRQVVRQRSTRAFLCTFPTLKPKSWLTCFY